MQNGRTNLSYTSPGTAYTQAGTAIYSTGSYGPRLSLHWGGVVASQISVESSGRIAIINNPGTSYEAFIAGAITSTSDFVASTHGTFGGRTRVGAGYIADIGGTGNSSGIAFGASGTYPTDGGGSYSSTKDLGYDSLPWRSAYLSGAIRRTNPLGGYLNGGYAGVETTTTPGLIYAIGSDYLPTASALASMYGVGYTHGSFAGDPLGSGGTWGFYVAAAGTMHHRFGQEAYRSNVPIVNTSTSASSFSGNITAASLSVSSGGTLGLVSGDIWIMSNAGFGILSANANRAIAITNSAVTANYHLIGTSATFSSDLRAPNLILAGSPEIIFYRVSNTMRIARNNDGANPIIYNPDDGSLSAIQFVGSSSGNALNITSTGTDNYATVLLGSSGGGSRNILLVGKSGVTNGFTIRHNGSAMVYNMANGNLQVEGDFTTTNGNIYGVSTNSVIRLDNSVGARMAYTNNFYQADSDGLGLYTGGSRWLWIRTTGNIETPSNGVFSAGYFDAIYGSSNGAYNGSFDWNLLQLGNNGPNNIVAGHNVAGGWLDFFVNNTNRVPGTTPNGIHAMRLDPDGTLRSYVATIMYNSAQSPNHSDIGLPYNVNLGSGGTEGRGLVAGYSGGSYAGIGYNVRHTSSSATWTAPGGDYATYILFNQGFTFSTDFGGVAGRTVSFTTLARIDNGGGFTSRGALFPGYNNSTYGEQSSYFLYGNTANSGIRTNGNFLVNSDIYWGANSVWLSSWIGQSVRSDASPQFVNIYATDWIRNLTSNTGLYNQANNTHFYSSSTVQWDFATAGGSYIQIALRPGGHASQTRGYIYADTSNNIGFLAYDGNWALRADSSRNVFTYSALFPGSDNLSGGVHQGSYYFYGNTAAGGIRTNGALLANTDIYSGTLGVWLSTWLNQAVRTDARPTFLSLRADEGFTSASAQGRFGGWYNGVGFTGAAAEVGYSSGEGYAIAYNRNTSAYSNMIIAGTNVKLQPQGGAITATGNIVMSNYGLGLVGLYNSTLFQAVYAMGESYMLPSSGGSTGSLYGLAWAHPNAGGQAANLSSHGLLVVVNGTTVAAISSNIWVSGSMTATNFYGIASNVAINYNNDSASTYQMLWGSGNSVYGTAGIYCNPSTDTIYANGNIIAYASSDSRYKDNQQLITNPIGKLLALRGMTFTWNNLQQDFKGNDYGLIYQDVAAVMPEITQMRENGYGAIKYEKVIPLLVEVGKNHEERIQELENKLQAYENKFGKLN